jgi:hypothetical protein
MTSVFRLDAILQDTTFNVTNFNRLSCTPVDGDTFPLRVLAIPLE